MDMQDNTAAAIAPVASPSPTSGRLGAWMADARVRIEQRAQERPDDDWFKDAGAIAALDIGVHPVTLYFVGRNARDESLAGYRRKVRHTKRWLIEAGMDPCFADAPETAFPWHLVDDRIATEFSRLLRNHYKSLKSRENLLGILRTMLGLCAQAGLLSRARRDRILEILPVHAEMQQAVGNSYPPEIVARLMSAARNHGGRLGLCNAAMIAVWVSTGVRVSELVDIDLDDVDLKERKLRIRRAKGGQPHQVWLHKAAIEHIKAWLAVRGTDSGPLFTTSKRPYHRMGTAAARQRIDRLQKLAGLDQRFATHDFRRTFITECLRNGTDPFVVARLVGHRNVTTTLRYDRRTEAEDRAAVDQLCIDGLGIGDRL